MRHNNVQKAIVYTAFMKNHHDKMLKFIRDNELKTINYKDQRKIENHLSTKKYTPKTWIIFLYFAQHYRNTGSTEFSFLKELAHRIPKEKLKDARFFNVKEKNLNAFLKSIEVPVIDIDYYDLLNTIAKLENEYISDLNR